MKSLFAVANVLVLVSLGCAVPEGAQESGGNGGDALRPAPDLVLDRVDGGGQLALSDHRGKVVLVDLWATWCAPCIAELPSLQKMAERFGPDDFLMLGVVLESGDADEIRAFVEEKGIHYPQVIGVDGTKESFGPFLGYPTKYLIDREGRVVKRYFGAVGDGLGSDIEGLIETGRLAKEPTS
ncbi:MAG TPA: TlpA disulfide reductase family protein [Vicinamibacteria bacterium]|nr:TlpA disulfide reductase family protein [Vicinamibacteria bacterium]